MFENDGQERVSPPVDSSKSKANGNTSDTDTENSPEFDNDGISGERAESGIDFDSIDASELTASASDPAPSRVKRTSQNVFFSLLSLLVTSVLSFVCRRVFIFSLGNVYVGLNSLFSNVLSMLSLVELGIGAAIVYSLYAPLANGKNEESAALVKLYAKIYRYLAVAVFAIGLVLLPLLKSFVKEDVSLHLARTVFLLYLADNAISYLFSHKRSLLQADQKAYVAAFVDLLFRAATNIIQIVILLLTKNLLLYVVVQLSCNLVNNLVVNRIVDKRYRHILAVRGANLPEPVRKTIIKNVKALFMHKIGDYCLNATDNLVLSYFINLSIVGIYANYFMIITIVDKVVAQIFSAAIASFGNLIATENKESTYDRFLISCFLNFWIVNILTVTLFFTLNPLIALWLGRNYMINNLAYWLLLLNFYLRSMRYSLFSVKSAAGVYDQDKFAPIAQSAVNLIFTIILVKPLGLAGVLMGTAISHVMVPNWVLPYMVHRYVFEKPMTEYLKRYLISVALLATMLTAFWPFFGSNNVSWLGLIYRTAFLLIVPTVLYCVLFRKQRDYQYITRFVAGRMLRKAPLK